MNIEALDLDLLVAFEALMLEHSVTKAGARVGLSQRVAMMAQKQ